MKPKTQLQTQNKDDFKDTEIGKIPKDWEVVRLGDVSEKMKAGGTPLRSKKEYYGGNIPFVLIEDITSCNLYLEKTKETITQKGLDNSNAWIVPVNSLLLSMYATIGATAINKIPVATNQAILAIIPKKKLDVMFGAYILKYHAERLKMHNIATTQKNVNKGIVENFKIPLPPLAEQKKIAYVLSSVQNAKEKTERVINSLKELKKSTMKHLFTYGAVSFEDKDKVELKDTEIGKVPKDWEVVRLGDVCEKMKAGGTPRTTIKEYWENGTIPLVKVEDVVNTNKFLVNANLSITEKGLNMSSAWLVPENSILLSMYGTAGEVCINKVSVAITQNVMGIIKKDNITTEFLYYALKYAKIYTLHLISDKTIFTHFSLAKAKNLPIPLPPLAEQKKISSILSAIDKKIEAEEHKKEALEQLFKSLLHNLMTGKIRVKDLKMQEVKE
ncbi:MAG: restriction endonuclease subunit S [Candidatus Pacearchaeota archaeon]|nr:restriction endonuclease subunit S [Candidatus Pacearchaeota archaeon]